MKKLFPLTLVAASLLVVGCNSSNDNKNEKVIVQDAFELDIAHVNDTHSSFDPVRSSFKPGSESTAIYTNFGGYPRIMQAANEARAQSAAAQTPMLFLHGGDAWQGSAYFKQFDGAANADLLSRMQLDAMALGNHEFDLTENEADGGNQKLLDFISAVEFPVVAANIDVSGDTKLATADTNKLKPYQLFAFDGVVKRKIDTAKSADAGEKIIAVIGLVLEDMPGIVDKTAGVTFQSEIETTQKLIDQLKADGVHNIILLTHIGMSRDIAVAKGTTGVDVIVGGHSHTLLGDFTDLGKGDTGQYAQMVNGACIVQAGEYAQAIGKVKIKFNQYGEVESCVGNNTLLSDKVFYSSTIRSDENKLAGDPRDAVVEFIGSSKRIELTEENATLRARINSEYKPTVDAAYGAVVGEVANDIAHVRRPGEKGSDNHGSDAAPIIAQGVLDWANSTPVQVALNNKKVHISFAPAGGVRKGFEYGDFKEGTAKFDIYPYTTQMSVIDMTGTEIQKLIASTIAPTLPMDATDSPHAGKFPYVGGMMYTFTETAKAYMESGERVDATGELSNVKVNMGTVASPDWQPLEDATKYTVVLGNYNSNGRDGWSEIMNAQIGSPERVDIAKAGDAYKAQSVVSYLYKNSEGNKVPVTEYDASHKYYAVYKEGESVDCKADGNNCNMDSQTIIDYFKAKTLASEQVNVLPFETVTVNYK